MSIYTPKGPAKQKPKLNCWRVLYYLLRDVLSELGKFRRVISDTLIVLHVIPHDIFTVSLWECLKWRSFSLSIYDLNFRKTFISTYVAVLREFCCSYHHQRWYLKANNNDTTWKLLISILSIETRFSKQARWFSAVYSAWSYIFSYIPANYWRGRDTRTVSLV